MYISDVRIANNNDSDFPAENQYLYSFCIIYIAIFIFLSLPWKTRSLPNFFLIQSHFNNIRINLNILCKTVIMLDATNSFTEM
jgi:hypothetical protein